jgi:hypothetical protein
VSKRIGSSIEVALSLLDYNQVKYMLSPLGKGDRLTTTEILIEDMPDDLLGIVGLSREVITSSFEKIVGDSHKLSELKNSTVSEQNVRVLEGLDPYARYRITHDQFKTLEDQLISYEELEQVAREKGFKVSAIRRAVGGDRMRLTPISPLWRPFVLGKKRYYMRDVLRKLDESDLTYKDESVRLRVRDRRRKNMDTGKRISFSRRDDVNRRVLELERNKV